MVQVAPLVGPGAVLVVDAAALVAVAERPELVSGLQERAILLPNPTEAARLLHQTDAEVDRDLSRATRTALDRFGTTVAVRGTTTWITAPGQDLFLDDRGHSALGTSGSGDVLMGMVAGLAARGMTPIGATLWGVHAHGLCGEFLAAELGGLGLLARDLLDRVAPTLNALASSVRGQTDGPIDGPTRGRRPGRSRRRRSDPPPPGRVAAPRGRVPASNGSRHPLGAARGHAARAPRRLRPPHRHGRAPRRVRAASRAARGAGRRGALATPSPHRGAQGAPRGAPARTARRRLQRSRTATRSTRCARSPTTRWCHPSTSGWPSRQPATNSSTSSPTKAAPMPTSTTSSRSARSACRGSPSSRSVPTTGTRWAGGSSRRCTRNCTRRWPARSA